MCGDGSGSFGTDPTRLAPARNEIREYRIRTYVRAMLKARGVKVPPNVVYEQVIGPATK